MNSKHPTVEERARELFAAAREVPVAPVPEHFVKAGTTGVNVVLVGGLTVGVGLAVWLGWVMSSATEPLPAVLVAQQREEPAAVEVPVAPAGSTVAPRVTAEVKNTRKSVAPPKQTRSDREEKVESIDAQLKLMSRATELLRVERAPERAIRFIEEHSSQLVAFVPEIALLRAEAYRALGQYAEALTALDALDGGPPGYSLQLMKAELLQETGRCGEALELFRAVVAAGGKLEQRARDGLVACENF